MTLPTTEQLDAKFDELHHVKENIENERMWYWYGIRAYAMLLSELAHEDNERFKAELRKQQDADKGYVAMQNSKPA